MELVPCLWLPILVSTALVFLASFVSYMLLPFHRREWARLPDEGEFTKTLGDLKIAPGKYMFPAYNDRTSLEDPEFMRRWERGPHGVLHLFSRRPSFGRNLGLTFVFYLVTAFVIAYLAGSVLHRGDAYLHVFRVTGTAALLAHLFAIFPDAIWFQKSRAGLFAVVLDAVVFSVLTAGAFAGFWPAA